MGEICHWWAGSSSDHSTFLINGGAASGWTFTRSMQGIVRHHQDDHWTKGDLHVGAIDFDNDGLLDLIIASSDYPDGQYLKLYKQLPDHTFVEVTELAGFDWEGCGDLSICDFNRDGREDILVGKSFMRLPAKNRRTHSRCRFIPQSMRQRKSLARCDLRRLDASRRSPRFRREPLRDRRANHGYLRRS